MVAIMLDMGKLIPFFYLLLSVGPLLAVLDVQDNGKISDEVEIPYWGLAFGGGSFAAGILSVEIIFKLILSYRLVVVLLQQLGKT